MDETLGSNPLASAEKAKEAGGQNKTPGFADPK